MLWLRGTYTGRIRIAATFLPDIDIACAHGSTLVGIEAPVDDGQKTAVDAMEYDVCVADRPHTDTGEGRLLHGEQSGGGEGYIGCQ